MKKLDRADVYTMLKNGMFPPKKKPYTDDNGNSLTLAPTQETLLLQEILAELKRQTIILENSKVLRPDL